MLVVRRTWLSLHEGVQKGAANVSIMHIVGVMCGIIYYLWKTAPPKTCNLQATQQSGAGGWAANRFTSDEAGAWTSRGKQPRNGGSTGAESRLQQAPPSAWPVRMPTGSDSSTRRQLTHDMLLPGSGGSAVPGLVGMQRGRGVPSVWTAALAQQPSLQGVVPQPHAEPHAVAQHPSLLAAQRQLREDQAAMDALAAEHHREQVQHAQQRQEHLAEVLPRQQLLSQGSLVGGPALAAKGSAESLGRLQRQAGPSVAVARAQDSPGARLRLRLQDLRQMQEQHQVTSQLAVHSADSMAMPEGPHAACRQAPCTPTSCHLKG